MLNDRNTPAYAGKTADDAVRERAKEKHPRVCGEDWVSICSAVLQWETPPRMRGRHLIKQAGLAVQGNTPAYAGKTDMASVRVLRM